MTIRTYQPGDEVAQVGIYNEAAGDLPKFKPATLDEVRRRARGPDFDPDTRFFAEDFGDVQGGGLGTLLALHRRGSPIRAKLGCTFGNAGAGAVPLVCKSSAILTGGGMLSSKGRFGSRSPAGPLAAWRSSPKRRCPRAPF